MSSNNSSSNLVLLLSSKVNEVLSEEVSNLKLNKEYLEDLEKKIITSIVSNEKKIVESIVVKEEKEESSFSEKDYKNWLDYPDLVQENILSYHCPQQSKKLNCVLKRIDNMILTLLLEKKNIITKTANTQKDVPFNLFIGYFDPENAKKSNNYYTLEIVEEEKQNIVSQFDYNSYINSFLKSLETDENTQ